MLEQITLSGWLLEVDKDATRAVYDRLPIIDCPCTYCRNYIAAASFLPEDFLDACNALSIDPLKAAEVWEVSDSDGTHFYGGWYHLVGIILRGPITEGEDKDPGQSDTIGPISGSFRVDFTEQADLVPDSFPGPILQMNFFGKLPWVLGEPPEPV